MPKRISDVFHIKPSVLREQNVFNGFIDIDSEFYVDPRLLLKTSAPELKFSHEKLMSYFNDALKAAYRFVESPNVKKIKIIESGLHFSEIPLAGLGYSQNHTGGKGIGNVLAKQLCTTLIEIVSKGVLDPAIFELMGVFEPGMGADRISDMIIHILLSDIAQFSSRVAKSLNLPTSGRTEIASYSFKDLPRYSNRGILFVPEDILTKLPVAYSLDRMDSILFGNEALRRDFNNMIQESWRHSPTWKKYQKKKSLIKEFLMKNPELIGKVISQYENQRAYPYNFATDPKDEFTWHSNARQYATRFPLFLKDVQEDISKVDMANIIAAHFQKMVKEGLWAEFHQGRALEPKPEKIGQLILLELLELYAEGSNLSIRYDTDRKTIDIHRRGPSGQVSLWIEITLKFTSTRGICSDYQKFLDRMKTLSPSYYCPYFLIVTSRGLDNLEEIKKLNSNHNKNNNFKLFLIEKR
ncbi:MAG: hypothetical protein N5P05_004435 (plasmid) [Chroococcopsis gigantea SAG 12.99]|jgi:hypothetical protein|nr:hypothetical protein [Chlorogloea purpurea SAG 13.99]MDV3002780.1 hypothetical protein [Chroococcopsis gigantea SAG 12.99]